jgi:hypothetical protein
VQFLIVFTLFYFVVPDIFKNIFKYSSNENCLIYDEFPKAASVVIKEFTEALKKTVKNCQDGVR